MLGVSAAFIRCGLVCGMQGGSRCELLPRHVMDEPLQKSCLVMTHHILLGVANDLMRLVELELRFLAEKRTTKGDHVTASHIRTSQAQPAIPMPACLTADKT